MEELLGILLVFFIIVLSMAFVKRNIQWSWPVIRPRIEATWPMFPQSYSTPVRYGPLTEGFANMTLQQWLPSPEALTKPTVDDCPGNLEHAAPYVGGSKSPYKSYDLLTGGKAEPRIASGPTAAKCYEQDWSVGLEPGGSYAQRTNNYKQNYPDSCTGWNHD
jgi:hypothetical protein